MNQLRWLIKYRSLTTSYIILVLLILIGVFRVEQIALSLNEETERRANLLCEQSNQNLTLIEEILTVTNPEVIDNFDEDLELIDCPPSPDDVDVEN